MSAVKPSTPSGSNPRGKDRAAARLVQHIVGGWRSQAIHAAVQMGVTDALIDGPRTADDLASALGCDADALARLLRALCTLSVCTERKQGRFALTSTGRLLCAHGEGPNLRALAQWWGGPLWPMWGELAYSIRTGLSARKKLTGDAAYAYLDKGADPARVFHEAQRGMTALVLDELVSWPGWARARTAVDVGGGHGHLMLAVLAAHDALHGTVFDLPHAQDGAQRQAMAAGLGERCKFESGSFFERVPAGADCYMLKSILHNWDDEHCAALLGCCSVAVPPNGRVLVVERVRPARLRPGARDEAVARTDLNMLAGLGGRERTIQEYAALLGSAGFSVTGVTPLAFEFSLIEACPRPESKPSAEVG